MSSKRAIFFGLIKLCFVVSFLLPTQNLFAAVTGTVESFYTEGAKVAFSYTYKDNDTGDLYVVAGKAESPSGLALSNPVIAPLSSTKSFFFDSGVKLFKINYDKTTGEITGSESIPNENVLIQTGKLTASSKFTRLPMTILDENGKLKTYTLSNGDKVKYSPTDRGYIVTHKDGSTSLVDPEEIRTGKVKTNIPRTDSQKEQVSKDAKNVYDYTKTKDFSDTQAKADLKMYDTVNKLNEMGLCLSTGSWTTLGINIGNCLAQVLYWILYLISYFVGFAGFLFNYVFEITVIKMSDAIRGLEAINIAWRTMRDLANISFIFILLYLAISQIIGLDEHGIKHTLSKLIIVAILINFSLFFTKVIIDASNIVAINFYNKINPVLGEGQSGIIHGKEGERLGLGDVFMSVVNAQTIYSTQDSVFKGAQDFAKGTNVMSRFMAGAVFLLLAFAILMASIMMFVKRFLILILLMAFAPVAFAGSILHATEHHLTQEWWSYLIKESIFAPIYMIMLWVVLQIITSQGFHNAINYNEANTLAAAFSNPATSGAGGVFLNFFIAGAAFIGVLIVAEHLGVKGADGAMSTFDGIMGAAKGGALFTLGAAYDNTLGKAARTYREKRVSNGLYAFASGQDTNGNRIGFFPKWWARAQIGLTNQMSKGYEKKLEEEVGRQKARDDEFHNEPKLRMESLINAMREGKWSTAGQTADSAHHHWNNEEHATIKSMLEDERATLQQIPEGSRNEQQKLRLANIEAALDRYYTGEKTHHPRISEEQQIAIARIQQDRVLPFHRNKLKELTMNLQAADTDEKKAEAGNSLDTFLKSTSDKQKGELIGTMDTELQDFIAREGDPAAKLFRDILQKNVRNYNVLDQAQRGAFINEKMKKVLGDIGYNYRGVYELVNNYGTHRNNPEYTAILQQGFNQLGVQGANLEEQIQNYNGSELQKIGKSFFDADRNLGRFFVASDFYAKAIQFLPKKSS